MMMLVRLTLLAVLACTAVAVPAAQAAFDPPAELATGDFTTNVTGVVDATGDATAVVWGGKAPQLVTRPGSAAAWSAPSPLPGQALGRAVGPVVSAAGLGAAAVTWRIDTPKRYSAIAAMARGVGEAFGEPVVVSPRAAKGVRHPAIAVDGEGRTILAYNTNTRAVHLSLTGGIAISLRPRDGAFAAPEVVDAHPSSAPAAAIGPDGRGVIAWLRDRRIWAVSVDAAAGAIGRVKALTPSGPYESPRVAAGPDGTATVVFVSRRHDPKTNGIVGATVAALRRIGGGTFPAAPQEVGTVGRRGFLRELAIAADDEGRTTVAWAPESFRSNHALGVNGVTSGERVAVAEPGARRFGAPAEVAEDRTLLCGAPSVSATAGRSVVGFECHDRTRWLVRAASLGDGRPGRAVTAMSSALTPQVFANPAPVVAGLDEHGTATLIAVQPHSDARTPVSHVLTTTGR
jgi:hypothetical protein